MTPHEIAFLSLAIPVAAGALLAVGYALYHLLKPLRPQERCYEVQDYPLLRLGLADHVPETQGVSEPAVAD